MSLLSQHGADIYVTDNCFLNVMHLAIIKNEQEIVEMLVNTGFPLDDMTMNKMTPLHIAARYNHIEITDIILNGMID